MSFFYRCFVLSGSIIGKKHLQIHLPKTFWPAVAGKSPAASPKVWNNKKNPSAFHKPPGSPERHVAADILSTWFATMPVDRENE